MALIGAACFGLGLAHAAVLLDLGLGGGPLPHAPIWLKGLLGAALAASVFSIEAIAYMAVIGEETVFGVDAIRLLALFFGAQCVIWWIYVPWTIYCYLRDNGRGSH